MSALTSHRRATRARPVARRARRHCAASLLAGLVLALTLGGCGVRLEAPPPPLPSSDVAEVARQGAAERAVAIAHLAEAQLAGDASAPDTLGRVAGEARAHAERLGGVWSPPAWATSTPAADDGAASTGTPAAEGPDPAVAPLVLPTMIAAARATCADAVALPASDLAGLLASICLAQERAAADLAAAQGEAAPGLLRPTPPEAATEELAGALAATDAGLELARALDAAGYALEVAAARSAGEARTTLAARADERRALAHVVVVAAGALGTAADPRRAAYDLADVPGGDPTALAAAVEADVLEAWGAVVGLVVPGVRAEVLAEMSDATAAAGAPPTAFPGLSPLP